MSFLTTHVESPQKSLGISDQTHVSPFASESVKVKVNTDPNEEVKDILHDLEDIYGEISPMLGQVLSLLSSAIAANREAIDFQTKGNDLKADARMLLVQTQIEELFSLRRSVGEGFAVVIGALMFAFINKAGMPFGKKELYGVLGTLNAIRMAPFCSIERAVQYTEPLEQAGLVIDPIPLSDLLSEAEEAGFVE